jgi:hypothetical protein
VLKRFFQHDSRAPEAQTAVVLDRTSRSCRCGVSPLWGRVDRGPRAWLRTTAEACEDAGMRERHPSDPLPMKPSDEPEVEPLQFVVRENAQGEQTLDLVEGSFEQSYRVGGVFTTKLFVDLCRSRGLLPYRHRRQRSDTICVRASLSEHEAPRNSQPRAFFLRRCASLGSSACGASLESRRCPRVRAAALQLQLTTCPCSLCHGGL